MARVQKANWNPDNRPMGVSPEEVLLGWLRQPGNFHRFSRARAKKAGGVDESKLDVAREILVLLQNADFQELAASGIVVRLTLWIKKYNAARELARAGGVIRPASYKRNEHSLITIGWWMTVGTIE